MLDVPHGRRDQRDPGLRRDQPESNLYVAHFLDVGVREPMVAEDRENLVRVAGPRLAWIDQQLAGHQIRKRNGVRRSEEHTSELHSLMRISYAVFCLKKKKKR